VGRSIVHYSLSCKPLGFSEVASHPDTCLALCEWDTVPGLPLTAGARDASGLARSLPGSSPSSLVVVAMPIFQATVRTWPRQTWISSCLFAFLMHTPPPHQRQIKLLYGAASVSTGKQTRAQWIPGRCLHPPSPARTFRTGRCSVQVALILSDLRRAKAHARNSEHHVLGSSPMPVPFAESRPRHMARARP
jgi:hypothetical protein